MAVAEMVARVPTSVTGAAVALVVMARRVLTLTARMSMVVQAVTAVPAGRVDLSPATEEQVGRVVPVVMPALTRWVVRGARADMVALRGRWARAVRAAVAVAVAKERVVSMARPLAIPLVRGVVLVAPEALAVLGAMAAVKQGTVVLAA
ncbi:MAG: hypothetical protein U0Q47_13030 [Mycobacterium sp.]